MKWMVNDADIAIPNAVADVTILSMPPAFLQPGRFLTFEIYGVMTSSATATQKVFRLKGGTTTLATLQFAPSASLAARAFFLKGAVTFRQNATCAGYIWAGGLIAAATTNLHAAVAATSFAMAQTFSLTGAHSGTTAGNTMTIQQGLVNVSP